MSVYIKGMDMPKEGTVIVIDSAGQVWSNEWPTRGYTRLDGVTAVPVPPHGRLIDAAALWVEINKICDRRDAGIITDLTCCQQLLSAVRHAPTIIPADKEGEE